MEMSTSKHMNKWLGALTNDGSVDDEKRAVTTRLSKAVWMQSMRVLMLSVL
jgi:hypothetical protein